MEDNGTKNVEDLLSEATSKLHFEVRSGVIPTITKVKYDENDVNSILMHGLYKVFEKDLEGALTHYKTAVQRFPDNANAHVMYGSMLSRLHKSDDAFKHYERAMELDGKIRAGLRNYAERIIGTDGKK